MDNAAAIVAKALSQRAVADRPRFLRELLAHVAAGLVLTDGEAETSEVIYRLADAVVARKARVA